jgi:hypothetical protein
MRTTYKNKLRRAEISEEFATHFLKMLRHSKTCRSCCEPIIDDEEGNPGFRSLACTTGALMIDRYHKLFNELLEGKQ